MSFYMKQRLQETGIDKRVSLLSGFLLGHLGVSKTGVTHQEAKV